MPTSPGGICRSCNSRAVANGYCYRHQAAKIETKRIYDRFRADDPVRPLYRCKRWERVRQRVLNRDILCRSCGHQAATDCDHILSARVVLNEYGKDAFYDPDRLQGLCHRCHSQKTATESGWTSRKGTTLTDLGDRSNTIVVCGESGSGKSTYIRNNKAPNDIVWEYDDVMATITGRPVHDHLPEAVGSVLADRDRWIEATRYSTNRCWLVVNNDKATVVQMMRDAGATVIVLNTPHVECQRRLKQRYIDETTV